MNRLEKLAHAVLNKLFKRRDVVIAGELYLRRWYLRLGGPRTRHRVFLHYIGKSDDVHVLHDHPWSFRSIVLARGYQEHLPQGRVQFRKPWTTYKVPATHLHAVTPSNGPAWTLVIAGPAERAWGFAAPWGWTDWRTYLEQPNAEDWPEDVIWDRRPDHCARVGHDWQEPYVFKDELPVWTCSQCRHGHQHPFPSKPAHPRVVDFTSVGASP